MTFGLMVMILCLKTGVYRDPSSIVSIASLMHHPQVLQDFRAFGDEIELKEMRRQLGDRRYKLDNYKGLDGI